MAAAFNVSSLASAALASLAGKLNMSHYRDHVER